RCGKLRRAGARDWKWQALSDICAATGIPRATPLVAAAADKACEVLGAGCREAHVGCLSYGTIDTIDTIDTASRRYVEVTPFVPPYPAALPDACSTEVQVFRGYWMVNWFKEQFGHLEHTRAHVYRAILEGLAYALREGRERIEQ